MKQHRGEGEVIVTVVITLVVVVVLGLLFAGLPLWNVWRSGLSGEAELRRAEQSRLIAITEAKAKLEAAKYLNQAEVERARGVAEANSIVADGLGGPEGYLRYLWVQGLQTNEMQVLYIPTEAGLPILEAGKRPDSTATK